MKNGKRLAIGVCSLLLILETCQQIHAQNKPVSLLIKGLAMLQLDDPRSLQIGFPKARGHSVTLTKISVNGNRTQFNLNGRFEVTAANGAGMPTISVPELVRMSEFYGTGVSARLQSAPTLISIPWSVITDVRTEEISDARYRFIRSDSGAEVETFRPRRVAESIRIEMKPDFQIRPANHKTTIDLTDAVGIVLEFVPERTVMGQFEDHFKHYIEYVRLPADKNYAVRPQRVTGNAASVHAGNSFLMIPPFYLCYPVGIP